MAWSWLFLAGLCEVAWAYGLKLSNGFTRPIPSLVTLVGITVSFLLLSQALKMLPLGIAYAVWTGIGALGGVLVGVWLGGDHLSPWQIGSLGLVLVGLVGLKLSTAS